MLAIIQARSSSKRFPKKIFKKIKKRTLIEMVIERLKKAKKIKKIIVAISNKASDDKLANYLKKKKIHLYRGKLNDVTDRLYNASVGNNYFVRINGDSPLIDPGLIDNMIKIFKKNKIKKEFDILTNTLPRTFPKGQSVEIVKRKILKLNHKKMSLKDKEHVTRFFYRHKNKFNIKNVKNKKKIFRTKFAIDTKKDLQNLIKFVKNKNLKNFTIYKI